MRVLLLWIIGLLSAPAAGLSLNGNGTGGSSPLVKSFGDAEFLNTVSTSAIYPVATGGTGPTLQGPVNGRVFANTTGASQTQNLQLTATLTGTLAGSQTQTWSSSAPSVATISTGGYVTQVAASGTATFFCSTTPPANIGSLGYTFSTTGGQTVSTFDSWAVVSPVYLPGHLNTQIDGLITAAGSYSGGKMNLYSAVNDTTAAYTRNTSCWTGAVDLSGLAVWESFYGNATHGGTLITPTDIVLANHWPIPAGNTIRFVDPSNVTFTATLGTAMNITGTDLTVQHLSWGGATPTTLKVMKVLPASYATYWPDHLSNFFPVIGTNQYRQAFVQTSSQMSNGSTSAFRFGGFYHNPSVESSRTAWTLPVVSGDSGQPVLTVINGEPVVLGCNYTATSVPPISDNITAVNAALATLDAGGTVYTLTPANLSSPIAFPTF